MSARTYENVRADVERLADECEANGDFVAGFIFRDALRQLVPNTRDAFVSTRETRERAADWLAGAVVRLVDHGELSARSEAGDAVLDYANDRWPDVDPLARVRTRYADLQAWRAGLEGRAARARVQGDHTGPHASAGA